MSGIVFRRPRQTTADRFFTLARTAARRLRPASFGADPSGERLERIRRSPNFIDGAFRNPVPTRTMAPGSAALLLRAELSRSGRRRRAPARPVPVHRPAPAELAAAPRSGLRLIWLGHSSVLADIDGARVLFDPVWAERCSPFRFAGPRRFHPAPLSPGEVEDVDVVVVSHDHYDHLDMLSVRSLLRSKAVFAVPLGVGAHLEHWGVPADRIAELDWNESVKAAGLTLTATPARHFCGRIWQNRMRTLWASWVVEGRGHRIFHSGDTGYFAGFARAGREHGPFDATMVQVGAYSEAWPEVHMRPEDAVQAHIDLMGGTPGGVLLPIHWATFNLAPHPWAEPIERTVAAARRVGVAVAVPRPGQPFEPVAPTLPDTAWWREVAVPPEGGWVIGASKAPVVARRRSAGPERAGSLRSGTQASDTADGTVGAPG